MAGEFPRSIDSLDEVFRFLDSGLATEALDETTLLQIHLVAEEIFTNMVRHNKGSSDRISVSIERTGSEIVLRITDFDADPWVPSSDEEVDVHGPIAEREPGGLGLHLVRSMVDRLSYENHQRQMTVTAVKKLER